MSSTHRVRDPIPMPTEFEIEGPYYRRIGIAARCIHVALAALAFGGASFLAGYFGLF